MKKFLNQFKALAKLDYQFEVIIEKYGLPKQIPHRPEGFETLVLFILEQQVSIASAKAVFLKMRSKIIEITPKNILVIQETDFKKWGVSAQKTKYIIGLANAIEKNEIDLGNLKLKTEVQIRAELIKLKGIGNWTIDVYLMFCLQHENIFPLGDIAIINTLKELFNVQTKLEMEEISKKWEPFRTAATYLLWHYYLNKRNKTINYIY